jgi:hypothetical protein
LALSYRPDLVNFSGRELIEADKGAHRLYRLVPGHFGRVFGSMNSPPGFQSTITPLLGQRR